VSTTWDPALYRSFDDHRSRPFHDLVARVGATAPRRVVDAGCGPGHLTSVLGARWPGAVVEAFDASPDMVDAARANGVDAVVRDVVDWTPEPDTDVVVANAVLQWEPTHPQLMRRWADALPAGGWLAVQVPGNFDAPSHVLTRELAAAPPWRNAVTLRGTETVRDPAGYAELLAPVAQVDAWETTYLQRLTGDDPVLRWISGTALRPVRDALDDAAYAAFVAELAPRLRAAYPPSVDGSTWFPFRRIFVVAQVG
jgi:trans-aconitate 2-methyltransferase